MNGLDWGGGSGKGCSEGGNPAFRHGAKKFQSQVPIFRGNPSDSLAGQLGLQRDKSVAQGGRCGNLDAGKKASLVG